MRDRRIVDNRYIVANLIACQKDAPRIVDPEVFASVFDLQEKVIEDILQTEDEKRALEVAPRAVDPIQQTVATALQSYLNHPDVDRNQAIEIIRILNQPMLTVHVRKLRQIHRDFQAKSDIARLLSEIKDLSAGSGVQQAPTEKSKQLKRDNLRLICFDFVTAG